MMKPHIVRTVMHPHGFSFNPAPECRRVKPNGSGGFMIAGGDYPCLAFQLEELAVRQKTYGANHIYFLTFRTKIANNADRIDWAEKNAAPYAVDDSGKVVFNENDEVLWEVTKP